MNTKTFNTDIPWIWDTEIFNTDITWVRDTDIHSYHLGKGFRDI